MGRYKEAPWGFSCPYKNRCPHLEGLSARGVFSEYQRGHSQENKHWRIREEMALEINQLGKTVREQAAQIDQLRAENKRLHQRGFKPRNNRRESGSATAEKDKIETETEKKKRGAPKGHPLWTRKIPDRMDRSIQVDAPCTCPHCHSTQRARTKLKNHLLRALDLICEKPMGFPKADTLRKRLVPGAREHQQVFAFIEFNGPPTNNHAERALRPLVIFRKVCMGTRSSQGSENISVFSSLTQTAKLQNASVLDLFGALLTGSAAEARDLIFDDST